MSDKPFYMTQAVVLAAILMIAMSAAGCDIIGGIFKAGIWIGVILVVLVVGLIVWLVRGRG